MHRGGGGGGRRERKVRCCMDVSCLDFVNQLLITDVHMYDIVCTWY